MSRTARKTAGAVARKAAPSAPVKRAASTRTTTRTTTPTATKKSGAKKSAPAKTADTKSLAEYNRKRDFTKTAEPAGKRATRTGALRFVIQKHAASHLHFDLRLEMDGVMRSWAVPKGPSADPSVKRLAMEVEDHPISYNTFEGTIPAGEYGGGTVMLWDTGTYTADLAEDGDDETAALAGYERGDLKVTFHGKRMRGSYVLVRTKGFGSSRSKPSWLLIKHRDQYARPADEYDIVAKNMKSVVSKRTMEQIAAAEEQ